MKKILVVAQFSQLPGEKGSNRIRFKVLCELLVKSGFDVTLVTSKFRELDRSFREDECCSHDVPYKIVLLDELGYTKNISIRRIISLNSFNRSLKKYLAKIGDKFDLIYACVPGLDSALTSGIFAKKWGIPFVIDVQDLWPEAMRQLVMDIPLISDIVFSPMQIMANRVYSMADGIMAVSKSYLEVASRKNNKSKYRDYVYIGSDINIYSNLIGNAIEDKSIGEMWISYIGSLGHSYDLKTFIEAVKIANDHNINVKAIILGSGPLEADLKSYATELKSNVLFTGWVEHQIMMKYLSKSDAVINAIRRKAPQSITNKIGDYLAAGKPILNGSLNQEFINLLNIHNIGINYEPENSINLFSAIEKLYQMNDTERKIIGNNARRLAETDFDRAKTYPRIINMINNILAE